jgi:hypothetical protein
MARPVGRPPKPLLAQIRSYLLNATEYELGHFHGVIDAALLEREARTDKLAAKIMGSDAVPDWAKTRAEKEAENANDSTSA